MKVYVVFHADIEDDRYVRAVCSTAERARAVADSPEAESDRGYARDHLTRGGTQESACCYVEAWELDSVVPLVTIDHAQASPEKAD
jgi:hypothetical protein